MLLYELGTREAPFAAIRESPAVVWAVAGEEARPPIPRGFPSVLGGLVRGCWSSDPDHRLTLVDVIDILEPTLSLRHLINAVVTKSKNGAAADEELSDDGFYHNPIPSSSGGVAGDEDNSTPNSHEVTPVHSVEVSIEAANSFHQDQMSWTGEIQSRLDDFVRDVPKPSSPDIAPIFHRFTHSYCSIG